MGQERVREILQIFLIILSYEFLYHAVTVDARYLLSGILVTLVLARETETVLTEQSAVT